MGKSLPYVPQISPFHLQALYEALRPGAVHGSLQTGREERKMTICLEQRIPISAIADMPAPER